jgi:hypothetical protein
MKTLAAKLSTFALIAVACLSIGAVSALACGAGGYSYAGLGATSPAFGIGATVTPLGGFDVVYGHVAGWVGVGGPRQGPNGTNEWLQVGFSGFPELTGNDLYYELMLPGREPTYHQLAANLPMGKAARFAVLEMHGRPNWWRVWLNGSPASKPIHMPGSHHRWAPIATAELPLPLPPGLDRAGTGRRLAAARPRIPDHRLDDSHRAEQHEGRISRRGRRRRPPHARIAQSVMTIGVPSGAY